MDDESRSLIYNLNFKKNPLHLLFWPDGKCFGQSWTGMKVHTVSHAVFGVEAMTLLTFAQSDFVVPVTFLLDLCRCSKKKMGETREV